MSEPAREIPPQVQEILDAISQGKAIVCYSKCHSCMFQACPGGWHTWADDPSDWESAVAAGKSDPRKQKCGCPCADGPELQPTEPDLDWISLTGEPCPVCGAEGACANDAEGRPLIHALTVQEDE
jgi:hypothetical protein